jgi:hypothetical protein
MDITIDCVASEISAIGLTTTGTSRTSRLPTLSSVGGRGGRNRNNIHLPPSLPNVGSTVMIGQNTSSRNTSIVPHQGVNQTSGQRTGRNSTRNVVTVTTSMGRSMRPIIDQLMSMATFVGLCPIFKSSIRP